MLATIDEVRHALERMGNLIDQRTAMQLQMGMLRDEILEQVKPELLALDAEWAPNLNLVQDAIVKVEGEVRAGVLQLGASVKGTRFRGSFVRGSRRWNSDKLDGYALAHPEILECLEEEGKPSVRISKV
jgi:hypothetical protein